MGATEGCRNTFQVTESGPKYPKSGCPSGPVR
ncbi:Uncharacterised protein [Mycobacteroides abscessus subsp. abscessus]|nr:Uncharacterised protein [Mycobacteroides abscessus subsp. abscessus]